MTNPENTHESEEDTSPEGAVDCTPDQDDEKETPNSREARMRVRAREAEAQCEGLRTVVASLQSRLAELYAHERLVEPADLWRSANVDGLLTENGDVDPAKVKDVVDAIEQERPHLVKRRGPKPDYTLGSSAKQKSYNNSWQELLKGGQTR